MFQENNLGAIQPGKLADLLVLDRDYLTIPADQIKDIKPVLTMVGGRVVYEAEPQPPTPNLQDESVGKWRLAVGSWGV